MATQKLKKSLPKRCTNERLKMRRAASWARGQDRKVRRRSAQERRERANRTRTGPTPWQEVRAAAAWQPETAPTKEKPRVVTRSTPYRQMRRQMDVYLGMSTINVAYLDEVHQRWTVIGKKLQGGAL